MINKDGKANTNGLSNENQNASSGAFKSTPSSTSLMKLAHKLDHKKIEGIMRKIPQDAEATSALVGEVDFLDTPAVSFVRLAEGTILDNFSEVPIPVRFLFVMLVPTHSEINYHELGRSFSTLMSNDVSHIFASMLGYLFKKHVLFFSNKLVDVVFQHFLSLMNT